MFFLNSYWINRVFKKFQSQGFKGLFFTLFNFLNKSLNPKHTAEFPFKHLFLKKRRLIKKFTKSKLDILDDNQIINVGNYLIKKDILNSESIIYSFGIGENIGFENQISLKFNCKVYCFDPTSLAIKFMQREIYDKTKINFSPFGIWKNDGKIKFYYQDEENQKKSGGSITNLFETSKYEFMECYKLSTLMKKNNHSLIDVLKLDIEGAAIDVIEDIVSDKIFPRQIIVEFEYSENDSIDKIKFKNWSDRLEKLILKLKENNYKCYNLPRYSHIPYSTIEVLFVKKKF